MYVYTNLLKKVFAPGPETMNLISALSMIQSELEVLATARDESFYAIINQLTSIDDVMDPYNALTLSNLANDYYGEDAGTKNDKDPFPYFTKDYELVIGPGAVKPEILGMCVRVLIFVITTSLHCDPTRDAAINFLKMLWKHSLNMKGIFRSTGADKLMKGEVPEDVKDTCIILCDLLWIGHCKAGSGMDVDIDKLCEGCEPNICDTLKGIKVRLNKKDASDAAGAIAAAIEENEQEGGQDVEMQSEQ